MITHPRATVLTLLDAAAGCRRAARLTDCVELPPELLTAPGSDRGAGRDDVALALGLLLFEDVCRRVPMARAYVADLRRSGHRLRLDHGAVRTVAIDAGALPPGRRGIARLLEPLGYRHRETYRLDRLGMTGHSYAHAGLPESLPQYFVSELHPERFTPAFRTATRRVLASSRDPLPARTGGELAELAAGRRLPVERAAGLLADLLSCFDRQHDTPSLDDYRMLAAESEEMAWIATEGQLFNHATDRVADVAAVAAEQRRLGRPVKDRVEVSRSGRVAQTAFRAAAVERLFVERDGSLVVRSVPGSFHEFISRRRLPDGTLDLAFDARSAERIFTMTQRDPATR